MNVTATQHDFAEAEKLGIQTLIEIGAPIKAICWKQPFASLMLPPHNKLETRTQRVHYRGLVLIVATATPYTDRQLIELCGGEQALLLEIKVAGHDGYINGAAIGIGILSGCGKIAEQDISSTFIKREYCAGRFGWRFDSVHAIEPIPLKGFQGWRDVNYDLRSKVKLI